MEQMSKEINDPFKLLASLWSMVPSVEDQQPRWGQEDAPRSGLRETKSSESVPGLITDSGREGFPAAFGESPPRGAALEKAFSSAETKSTNSGSDEPPVEDTPPSSSRTRP
jgi:hypothetical protein